VSKAKVSKSEQSQQEAISTESHPMIATTNPHSRCGKLSKHRLCYIVGSLLGFDKRDRRLPKLVGSATLLFAAIMGGGYSGTAILATRYLHFC
jgi:hypothetical protein